MSRLRFFLPVVPWALTLVGVACIVGPATQSRFDGLSIAGMVILLYAAAIFIARYSTEDDTEDQSRLDHMDRARRGAHNERHGR